MEGSGGNLRRNKFLIGPRLRYAIALSLGAIMLSHSPSPSKGSDIWDGGGTTNSWSDRFNWSDDQLPSGTGTITFPIGSAQPQNAQDYFVLGSGATSNL